MKARVVSTLLDNLFEKFSTYRLAHPKAAYDGTRWTRYAAMLEKFLDCKDKSFQRPWELLPVLPPGHHVYPNGDAHVSVGMIGRVRGDNDSRGSSRTTESGSEKGEEEGAEEVKSPTSPKSPKSPKIGTLDAASAAAPDAKGGKAAFSNLVNATSPDGAVSINSHGGEGLDIINTDGLDVRPLSRANLDLLEEQFEGFSRPNSVPARPITAEEKRLLQETHVLVNGELQAISRQSVQESQNEKLRQELYSSGSLSRPNKNTRVWVGATATGSAPGTASGTAPGTAGAAGAAGLGATTPLKNSRPATPGELLAQERQLRITAAAGGEFFPWADTGADPLFDGFGSSAHSEGSDGGDRDDFSAISMNSGSFPEWDHDTDDGAFTGLHGLADGTRQPKNIKNRANPKVEEVEYIGKLFFNARTRIDEWVQGAEKETELAKPVPCWLGCGFEEAVEGVAMHVRQLCPFRAKECSQCHGIYRFADLVPHQEKDCIKRKIGCANAFLGCAELVSFDFVYQHENLRCRYRAVPCRLACGGMIPYCKRDDHEEVHCNKRPLECDKCHQMVHAALYGKHLKNECVERLVTCRVSCQRKFKFKDLEAHEKNVCVALCKWGCAAIIGPEQKRQLHELLVCPHRPVPCAANCSQSGGMSKCELMFVFYYII